MKTMNLRRPTTIPTRAPWWVRNRLNIVTLVILLLSIPTTLLIAMTGPSDIEAESDMADEMAAAQAAERVELENQRVARAYRQGVKAGRAQCLEVTP